MRLAWCRLRRPLDHLGVGDAALGQAVALIEQEAIKHPEGQDLGVPVMKTVAIGVGELGRGETLHAGPFRELGFRGNGRSDGGVHDEEDAYARARQVKRPCSSATMPLRGTHSRTPLSRAEGFRLAGSLSNSDVTAWAMRSARDVIYGLGGRARKLMTRESARISLAAKRAAGFSEPVDSRPKTREAHGDWRVLVGEGE